MRATVDRPPPEVPYYNRLDAKPLTDPCPTTAHPVRGSVPAASNTNGSRDRRATLISRVSRVFVSLVEKRKSCHKRRCSVTLLNWGFSS
jgi:hypothetical protein